MKELFEKLSAECCTDLEFRNTMNVVSVFEREKSDDLNENNLYLARFGRVPNRFRFFDIDNKKANEWILQNYRDKITDCYYDGYDDKNQKFAEVLYFLFDDLLVKFKGWGSKAAHITFLYRKTDSALVDKLKNELKQFKKRNRNKPEMELLTGGAGGYSTQTMEISRPKLSIEDNYNDDFLPVHQSQHLAGSRAISQMYAVSVNPA